MIDRRFLLLGGLAGLALPARSFGQRQGGGAPPLPPPAPPPAPPGNGGFSQGAGNAANQGQAAGQRDAARSQQSGTQPVQATQPQPARIQALVLSQSYRSTPQFALANTGRDGELMARAFQRLRFEQVSLQGDAEPADTLAHLLTYLHGVDGDTIAIVYLAGHGMEVGGENLLMLDGGETFLSLQALVQALQARAGVAILFVDACRNNPFRGFSGAGAQVSRAVNLGEGGAVRMETVSLDELRSNTARALGRLHAFSVQGSGIKIVFSTDPANVAYDGATPDSRNSPFAQALARRIRDQISLDDIVSLTTGDVIHATRGRQSPWSQGSIDRPIFLSGHRRREQRDFR
jgi:uncharacterized caspase-like protein